VRPGTAGGRVVHREGFVMTPPYVDPTPGADRAGRPPSTLWDCLVIGFSAMRRHPRLAALFLVVTAAQGLVQGLLIWSLRNVLIAFSDPGRSTHPFMTGAALVLGIWMLRSASALAAETLSVSLSYRVELEAIWRALTRLLRLSIRFFDHSSQGNLVLNCYQDIKGIRAVTFEVGRIILCTSQLAGLAMVAWLLSPELTIIGMIAVPIAVLPAYWLGQRITRAASRERASLTSHYDSFLQISSGIRVIKVNRCEGRVFERTKTVGLEMRRQGLRQVRSKGVARFLLETVAGVGLVLVLTIGGRDIAAGRMEWQSLLGLLIAIIAVYSPLVGLLEVYNNLRAALPSLQGVDLILNAPMDTRASGTRRLRHAPTVIEFRHVWFGYGDQPVLKDICATFHGGETIGIVGSSGAGKSTLMALLLRFYVPTSGAILVDGVDLQDIAIDDWMDLCALVQQEPFLFTDTVASNIRSGRPDATMDDVVSAARAASIHEDIVRMEAGYETVLGRATGARGLSGGQKQRVCIASALLKNAPLLFLDEATNSLDSVSEQRVQRALDRLMTGRTTFVIAHRFSSLRRTDRILVLDDGRLTGTGAHRDLIATNDAYRTLWLQQTAGLPGVECLQ
jgi:subfamily B ATP-binding cassette protein MsbA